MPRVICSANLFRIPNLIWMLQFYWQGMSPDRKSAPEGHAGGKFNLPRKRGEVASSAALLRA